MYAYRSIVRIGTELYDLKRIFHRDSVKNEETIKKWLDCTDCFHTPEFTLFCQLIESIDFEDCAENVTNSIITEMKCTVIETIYYNNDSVATESTNKTENE